MYVAKSPRKQKPHPSAPDGPVPSLESAEGAAGVLDVLANELVLLLLTESGILATIPPAPRVPASERANVLGCPDRQARRYPT